MGGGGGYSSLGVNALPAIVAGMVHAVVAGGHKNELDGPPQLANQLGMGEGLRTQGQVNTETACVRRDLIMSDQVLRFKRFLACVPAFSAVRGMTGSCCCRFQPARDQ